VKTDVKVEKWKCTGTISRNLLGSMSDLVEKLERRTRNPWITQEVIGQMDE
jgi:hypothetical protein